MNCIFYYYDCKMNILIRYSIYTLLYVPFEIIFILLLINFIIYNIIVFVINTYYYVTQSEKRTNGVPYSKVINYQDNFLFFIETANYLSYNTLVLKLRSTYDREEFKRNVSEKILAGVDENNEALFPKLRQVASRGYFFSTWENHTEFNVDEHVVEQELDLSVERNVERYVSEIDKHEIDRKIPQWRIHLIKDPNLEDISYIAWRVHHGIGDASSMWKVVFKLCDMDHTSEIAEKKLAFARLTPFQRIMGYAKTFLCIPMYLTDLLVFVATYHRSYPDATTDKRCAWSNQLDFEKIREIKSKTKTSVNDLVMTLVTESTRRYFSRRSREDIIEKDILYGMGASLDFDIDNNKLTNNDIGILIMTPTSAEGMFNQLKIINQNMSKMKHELWGFFYSIILSLLVTLPIPVSVIRKCTAVGIGTYSNFPGPTSTLVFNGAIVDETYGILMTSWNQLLALVFITYKGNMCVGVKADSCLVEEPRELVDEFVKVLEEMYVDVRSIP